VRKWRNKRHLDRRSQRYLQIIMPASTATTLSAFEDEYVRLKLELAQVTAATDTKRLQSRTLISERDGGREDTEKIKAETEVQQVRYSLCTDQVVPLCHLIMCARFPFVFVSHLSENYSTDTGVE
jgi:hypothetical protein